MKLWMIRHGESETNRLGQWTGWLDAALTDKGREYDEGVRAMLRHLDEILMQGFEEEERRTLCELLNRMRNNLLSELQRDGEEETE